MAKINKSLNHRESKIHKDWNFFWESPYSGLVASNLRDENDPHHIYVKYSEWKKVKINGNKLMIWDDVVCSWSDDRTKKCDVSLSLDWKEVKSKDVLKDAGTLTVTDEEEKSNTKTIKLNVVNNAPTIDVKKSEIDVSKWKEVIINNNKLTIWGEEIASWSDKNTSNCDVRLTLNWKDVKSWDVLGLEGILTIKVINKDWRVSSEDIHLHALHDISANSLSDEKIRIIRNWLMHESYTVDGDKLYIDNPTSYPTVIEAVPLKKFLSTIITNHPWCTIEEAIKIITDNYLVEKQYKYKDVDWNIKEWLIYSIDIDKFYKDEVKKSPKKD